MDFDTIGARYADPEWQRETAVLILATKVGFALRMVRLRRGLTIDELAERCGASPRAIRQIERGEYTHALRPLSDIAFALDAEIGFEAVPWDRGVTQPEPPDVPDEPMLPGETS